MPNSQSSPDDSPDNRCANLNMLGAKRRRSPGTGPLHASSASVTSGIPAPLDTVSLSSMSPVVAARAVAAAKLQRVESDSSPNAARRRFMRSHAKSLRRPSSLNLQPLHSKSDQEGSIPFGCLHSVSFPDGSLQSCAASNVTVVQHEGLSVDGNFAQASVNPGTITLGAGTVAAWFQTALSSKATKFNILLRSSHLPNDFIDAAESTGAMKWLDNPECGCDLGISLHGPAIDVGFSSEWAVMLRCDSLGRPAVGADLAGSPTPSGALLGMALSSPIEANARDCPEEPSQHSQNNTQISTSAAAQYGIEAVLRLAGLTDASGAPHGQTDVQAQSMDILTDGGQRFPWVVSRIDVWCNEDCISSQDSDGCASSALSTGEDCSSRVSGASVGLVPNLTRSSSGFSHAVPPRAPRAAAGSISAMQMDEDSNQASGTKPLQLGSPLLLSQSNAHHSESLRQAGCP